MAENPPPGLTWAGARCPRPQSPHVSYYSKNLSHRLDQPPFPCKHKLRPLCLRVKTFGPNRSRRPAGRLNLPTTAPSNGVTLPVLLARRYCHSASIVICGTHSSISGCTSPYGSRRTATPHALRATGLLQAGAGLIMVLFSNSKSLRRRLRLLAGFSHQWQRFRRSTSAFL